MSTKMFSFEPFFTSDSDWYIMSGAYTLGIVRQRCDGVYVAEFNNAPHFVTAASFAELTGKVRTELASVLSLL